MLKYGGTMLKKARGDNKVDIIAHAALALMQLVCVNDGNLARRQFYYIFTASYSGVSLHNVVKLNMLVPVLRKVAGVLLIVAN